MISSRPSVGYADAEPADHRTGSKQVAIRQIDPGNSRDARRFVGLPYKLHRHDPRWVPPLRVWTSSRIDPSHPANSHQETAFWMAFKGRRPIGRIGACVDRLSNEVHGHRWAWLGFFECEDDDDAAKRLFSAALTWAHARGMDQAVGPSSFTMNDQLGLLVDGFETPPAFFTPSNPAYYQHLWTDFGWDKFEDLYGWELDRSSGRLTERHERVLARLKGRMGVRQRRMDLDRFDEEAAPFFRRRDLSPWAETELYTPMTEAEAADFGSRVRRLLSDPDMAWLCERQDTGEPIGMALAAPDLTQALIRNRDGRLFPRGYRRLKRTRYSRVRVIVSGLAPKYKMMGLGPICYDLVRELAERKPEYQVIECSQTLESNYRMNSALEALGARRYKTWRLYRMSL